MTALPSTDRPLTAGPLWMMHVLGPDDIYPAPDHATAVEWCAYLNREISAPDVLCVGVPAIWTGSAEDHASGLAEAVAGWTRPAPVPEAGEGVETTVPAINTWSDWPRRSHDRRYEIGLRSDQDADQRCPFCLNQIDQTSEVVIIDDNGALAICHSACLPDECAISESALQPAPTDRVAELEAALRTGDLWGYQEDWETTFDGIEDAYDAATQGEMRGVAALGRATQHETVFAVRIDIDTTGDGDADDYEIRLFPTREAPSFPPNPVRRERVDGLLRPNGLRTQRR